MQRRQLWNAARSQGAAINRVVSTAVYGTRYQPEVNASLAASRRSAIGKFAPGSHMTNPSSVWNGPPRALGTGEPVLRRARTA